MSVLILEGPEVVGKWFLSLPVMTLAVTLKYIAEFLNYNGVLNW